MNNEPVGTVIETEEIYGHTFKKRKSKRVQWLKEVDVGTLLYVNPPKEDEGKVCARCGAIAYDPVIKQTSKELTDEEINVVAILQDAKTVPVGYEIWKTSEEFNKYKKIVLATARAILKKASEK